MTFKVRLNHNIILAAAMADGLSASNISALMGVSVWILNKYFSEALDGYTFKRQKQIKKEPYVKGSRIDTSRDADICEMYKSGETLQSIGESYGVCRERIRQILKRYDITKENGGQKIKSFKKICEDGRLKKERTEQRMMSCYGCTKKQWGLLRAMDDDYNKTPIRKWREQKTNAIARKIVWNLTLWEWWTIWSESGHYGNRGLGYGKYVMGRIADSGDYCISNIEIIKHEDNSKDYYDVHFDEWYDKLMSRKVTS